MQSPRVTISSSIIYFHFKQYPGTYRELKIQTYFLAQYPAFNFSFSIGEMKFSLTQLFQMTFLDAFVSRNTKYKKNTSVDLH